MGDSINKNHGPPATVPCLFTDRCQATGDSYAVQQARATMVQGLVLRVGQGFRVRLGFRAVSQFR